MEAVLPPESPSSEEDHQRKCLKNVEVPGTRDTANKSNGSGKVGRNNGDTISVVELARKPYLTEEDVKCPICWSILYEPTTLPCKHSLCKSCYLKHAEETSLYCPCCRRRLSIWSRKAKKQNELLDQKLWSRLKIEFPNLIQAKINGDEFEGLLSDKSCSHPSVRDGIMSSAPGVIFAELKQVLKPHLDDLKNERLRTDVASINLIKQIEEDDRKLLISFQERERQDFVLATQLHEELNFGDPHDKPLRKSTRVRKPSQKLSCEFVETPPRIVTRRIPKEEKLKLKPVLPLEKQRLKKIQQSNKNIRIASTPAICSSSSSSNQSEAVEIEQIKSTDISTVSCSPTVDEPPSFSIQKNPESSMDSDQPQKYNSASTEPFPNNLPGAANSATILSYAAAKILCMLKPEDELIPPSDNEDEDYRSSALKQAEVTLMAPERVSFVDDDDSTIDYDKVVKEADAVAARQQEQADRAFAELLQKKIRWGIDEGKDSEKKYSLRAWKRTKMSENVST